MAKKEKKNQKTQPPAPGYCQNPRVWNLTPTAFISSGFDKSKIISIFQGLTTAQRSQKLSTAASALLAAIFRAINQENNVSFSN